MSSKCGATLATSMLSLLLMLLAVMILVLRLVVTVRGVGRDVPAYVLPVVANMLL